MTTSSAADSNATSSDATDTVRAMTATQLAQLGVSQLAYVRMVRMNGQIAYSIHSADGTPMAIAADQDLAVAAIQHHELTQVLIH